jgi:predicted component of type VI protein secretion system
METDQAHSHLIMLQGPHPEKIFRLSEEEITLGREMQNDLVISDPEVSRKHARLRRAETGYTIEDLGSTNGTFVNGARITRAVQLADGDRVSLGETIQLVYQERMPARDQTVVAGVGTATPPLGEAEKPAEPSAEMAVPSEAPVPAAAPPPSRPVEPAQPYEAEVLEPPPPFDEPMPAAGAGKEPAAEQEPESPPAPEPPPAIERERPPAPAPFEPGVPARFEEQRQVPPPPPYEPPRQPVREPAREPGPPVTPPLGEPYRPPQRREPPPPPYYEEYEPEPPQPPSHRRRNLLIGCGCLLILFACAAVIGLGYLIWNAPYEFFQDPIRNFSRLFERLTMLLMLR